MGAVWRRFLGCTPGAGLSLVAPPVVAAAGVVGVPTPLAVVGAVAVGVATEEEEEEEEERLLAEVPPATLVADCPHVAGAAHSNTVKLASAEQTADLRDPRKALPLSSACGVS